MIHIGRALPPAGLPPGALAERVLRERYHREQARRERDYLRSRGIRDPRLDGYLDAEKRHAAIALDGTAALSATGTATSRQVTGRTIAANSLVVLGVKWEDADEVPSVDATSNAGVSSWTQITEYTTGGPYVTAFYGISSGYSGTVKVNFATSAAFAKLAFAAFSGIDTSSPLDHANSWGGNSGSSAGSTVAAITNSGSADALYVYFDARYGAGAYSALAFGGVSGTELWDDGDTLGGGYLIVSSSASRGGAQTGPAVDWATCMLVFKAAAAGGTEYTQSVSGSVTPTGALVRQTSKAHAGSILPSGAVTRQTGKALSGSITPSGTLAAIKTALVSLAGSVTAVGTLALQVGKGLAGSVTPAGELVRTTLKSLVGSVTASGVLAAVRTVLVSLAGSVTPSGTLAKQASKALTGSVTAVGSLAKLISKALSGAVTAVGTLLAQSSAAEPDPPELIRPGGRRARNAPYPQRGPLARPSSERRRKG